MTIKELKMQYALGTLPPQFKHPMCRNQEPQISLGHRTCHLCGKRIIKGEECYRVILKVNVYWNMCKGCNTAPFGHILSLLDD